MVSVYLPQGGGRADFLKNLERFLATSKTLILFGGLNAIVEAQIDCVCSAVTDEPGREIKGEKQMGEDFHRHFI